MLKKEDLRIIKTRNAIKDAFFALLNEKTFEKITVADIAEKAVINRGTFYLHYKDKFDLLESLEREVMEQIDSFIQLITEDSIRDVYEHGKPLPHLIPLFSFIQENPMFFTLISRNSTGSAFFDKIVDKHFSQISQALNLKENETVYEYIKVIASSVSSSVIKKWIERDMKESKEQLSSLITCIMISNLSLIYDMGRIPIG